MAQTKRKRRTKHRGNAAGIVETRGRTGRKPTAGERGSATRADARQRREDRLNRAPTWRGAANRAAIAALVFGVLIVLLFKRPLSAAVPLVAFMFLLYIPLGYYTDLVIYKRRMRKQGRPV